MRSPVNSFPKAIVVLPVDSASTPIGQPGNLTLSMAKPTATKRKRAQRKDPYMDAIGEVWPHILRAYKDFKDKKPVIEYELPRRMIYAFPAADYINGLTDRTKEKTREICRQAAAGGEFLVFVRDTKRRILRSYVFPVEEQP